MTNSGFMEKIELIKSVKNERIFDDRRKEGQSGRLEV